MLRRSMKNRQSLPINTVQYSTLLFIATAKRATLTAKQPAALPAGGRNHRKAPDSRHFSPRGPAYAAMQENDARPVVRMDSRRDARRFAGTHPG
ncbi:hypothetical protein [Rhodopila globiformis]|uniref:hypothetical protein n=1 Tax=Rhodopila globiformis TaxID=1071 RepID=UPI0011B0191A|nr:hypothetical protein [Rhodopila globiformis]